MNEQMIEQTDEGLQEPWVIWMIWNELVKNQEHENTFPVCLNLA